LCQPSLRDLFSQNTPCFPAIDRRATLICPSGAGLGKTNAGKGKSPQVVNCFCANGS
jgi:hypothetical protein